jgi:hypothetical protein
MGALITTCPATGRRIETGIETDRDSMVMTPEFVVTIHCPHCDANHDFSKHDIFVCELVDGVVQYLRAA